MEQSIAIEEKVCRICLQDDDPNLMISPCLCKGSSKWVHRSCLDEWRIHEKDRAFSQCTECQFIYYMEAVGGEDDSGAKWRRIKYSMLVSRDVCAVSLLLQLIICLLGWIVYAMDEKRAIVEFLNGGSCQTTSFFWCNYMWSTYYLCGLFCLFVLLGIYGCLLLCKHKCNCRRAFQELREEEQVSPPNDGIGYSYQNHSYVEYNSRSTTYQRPRYRQYRYRRHSDSRCCADCCDSCCVGGGYGGHCYCCYSCPDCGGCSSGSSSGSNNHGMHSSSGSNNGMHIFLIVLMVIVIVMAVIGFFVGVVLAVVVGQRILQRHVFLLHKKRLVREFIVKDLQECNGVIPTAPPMDRGGDSPPSTATAPSIPFDAEAQTASPAAPTSLHQKDRQHLKKLGLME